MRKIDKKGIVWATATNFFNPFLSCRPKDPLRVLGEFLLQRSKELETSA